MNLHPEVERKNFERLEAQIREFESKLDNIRKAIEEGAPYRVFQARTEELENEGNRLAALENENRQKLSQTVSIESSAEGLRQFTLNFEEKIALSSIPEKRDVIRKCVDRIYVDNDQKTVRFFLRKIPIANREVTDLYAEGGKQTGGHAAASCHRRCSGGGIRIHQNAADFVVGLLRLLLVAGENTSAHDVLFDISELPL